MDPPWIDGPSHWGDPEYEKAMSQEKIIVEISARIEYSQPPATHADEVLREEANKHLQRTAARFAEPLGGLIELALLSGSPRG